MTARTSVAGRIAVRLATSLLVLWGAVTVAFVALHLTPGDVVDVLIGNSTVTPEVRAAIISDYGLDQPLLVQYVTYLGRVLRGDLGRSYQLHQPVAEAIGSQIGASIQLTLSAFAMAVVVAVTVSVLTAKRSRWIRGLFSGIELVGVSIPTFWGGILLLTFFSFTLGLFPVTGGLVLPAVALAIPVSAILTQVLREGLELTLDEPFILTARSRGMADLAVRVRHALRHALLPTVTLAGWFVGVLFGGAVIVEEIFSREGIGRLTLTAVTSKDLPVVMGVVLVSATLYVVVNIMIDLFYLAIDPRLRGAR
ncbi:ABC transporter permease [Planotetraspora sp. A-T 1434]|uniref:ABC transporter permease n=1 Tax=Planotetraspora sp. A-T 1434 TaxID=2979219 RepID=UPI0021BF0BCD|nr:ABC transporter permease [Planotetraspora sp. A-T 1434]MCT9934248.1 ABC transporter permease [Planotetraspora sp. A-T 1434]